MPVTRTAIKTFKRAKSKENIAETKTMVKAGLNSTVSPTEKKAPGSIHEILEQMQVSADNPGKCKTRRISFKSPCQSKVLVNTVLSQWLEH